MTTEDRPTRAEAEADCYFTCPACDEPTYFEDAYRSECRNPECGFKDEQEHEGPTCIICDGLGHNYIVGWEERPGKGMQPIIGGPTCPIEDPRGWDPRDDEDLPF